MKFSELHLDRLDQLDESTGSEIPTPAWGNKDEVAKLLKSGKGTFLFGKWEKQRETGVYLATDDAGQQWRLKFNSITSYDVKKRIRNPAGTKYQVYAELTPFGGSTGYFITSISIASSRGEGPDSQTKVEAGVQKGIQIAHKSFGITLGKFDFAY